MVAGCLALLGVAALVQHLGCELAFPTHLEASAPCTAADTGSDDANCGACGRACHAGVHCYMGICGGGIVTQVSAGLHACALVQAGTVFCWGSNLFGETGSDPSTGSCGGNACVTTPTEVGGLTGVVVEVRAGNYSTCARKNDGTVWCWGQNAVGQLGHPPTQSAQTCNNAPCDVNPTQVPGLTNVRAIDVGNLFACALDDSGSARCWGDNRYGELGNGTDAGSTSTPTNALLDAAATAVSTGLDPHACALLDGGAIACWGENHLGALGHDPATDPACGSDNVPCSGSPIVVSGITGATAVRTGNGVTCALVGNGGVSCWGDDGLGQFGNGTVVDGGPSFVPRASAGGQLFRALDGRYDFTLALDSLGKVWAWGASSYGALGGGVVGDVPCENDGSPCKAMPASVTFPAPASIMTQVSAGEDFGLALDSEGAVWAWGANGSGQLGHAPGVDGGDTATCGPDKNESCRPTPTRVPGFP